MKESLQEVCSHCGTTDELDEHDHCAECQDKFALCSECGNMELIEEGTVHRGNFICESCLYENWYTCDDCGNLTPMDDVENDLCPRCWSNNYFHCESCGDSTRQDDMCNVEGDSVCPSCEENDATFCHNCDQSYWNNHYSDSRYHDCEEDNDDDEETIHSYSYKPRPEFFGDKGKVYYGIELEVESQNRPSEDASKLSDHSKFVYCKSDGSLSNGFEIVSHPATLEYHRMNHWKEILTSLQSSRCKSHDTTTCGLHIHMSRTAIPEERDLKKFVLFWYTQQKVIRAIARRGFNTYCMDKNMGTSIMPSNSILSSETRYEQINLQGDHTIEVRRFKGTLNYVSFMACLELVDASRVYTALVTYKDLRNVDLTESNFLQWAIAKKKQYPHLVEKLMQKMKFTQELDSE